jgi:hypothetical protein
MAHPKFFAGFGGIVLLLVACQREPIELHTTVSTFRESGWM